jgi:lipopolysaccharide export system permease protein
VQAINLEFFPSRRLTIYLARMFAMRILAVLVLLVLVLQVLDLLGESGEILAYPGNGEPQLWTYVMMRAPQLVARFLPYSVLLATIITLATLNQNSEVVSMKAAGLSAHQILAPLVLTATVIAGLSFAFNERVVTRATSTLSAWQAVKYGPIPKSSDVRSNVFLADGKDVLMATTVTGEGAQMVMEDVTFYHRDPDGQILQEFHGARAVYANPGWRMDRVTRFDSVQIKTDQLPSAVVGQGITPRQVAIEKVDADGEDIFTLGRSIAALDAANRRTDELRASWWHKLSGPLSAILMPILGAVAAFGLARSGQLLLRSVTGMALGFAFFVADNAAMALGNFGAYPAMIAAWGPFVLFAMIGETVLIRTEE